MTDQIFELLSKTDGKLKITDRKMTEDDFNKVMQII